MTHASSPNAVRHALIIDDCMSPAPYTVQKSQTLAEAHAIMREHQIRHLPVVDGTALVGLLSLRDLFLLETFRNVDQASDPVEDAMTPNPYAVQLGTPLRDVAIRMNAHKYGSAVVLNGTSVVGVFTTVDAMRVLANVL